MSSRNTRPSLRPTLEVLEDRTVLSVTTSSLSAGVLTMWSNDAASNVVVSQSGTSIKVYDSTNGFTRIEAGVTKVQFVGGAGNDRFVNNVYSLPVTAWGQGGNDYLEGYNGNDTLMGGDGNDTLVGYGGNDAMWGGNGNDILKGMAGDDTLYGDGGDDKLVGGDGNDTLYGGDGNDSIIGGAGTDSLYGGNGDDTLVTIDGGTTDYADGQAGRDTVWEDKNTVWHWYGNSYNYDNVYAEKIQAVGSFANGADRTLDGDSIADPTDGKFYKNFSANPLFGTGGPTANDIDQEALGDCWIMASLGSVAQDSPGTIRSMVADFGDGTYGVRLGNNFYRVDADLPTWNATSTDQQFAGLGRDGSLWVALTEKAYASYRTGANTYASLAGGDPADALRAYNLTSVGQSYFPAGSNSASVANSVFTHWNAYQSCNISTGSVPAGSKLVGNHVYTVTSVIRNSAGQVTSIVVRNPWGGDNTNGNPFVTLSPADLAACQIWVTWGNA